MIHVADHDSVADGLKDRVPADQAPVAFVYHACARVSVLESVMGVALIAVSVSPFGPLGAATEVVAVESSHAM
jgi:hypothetical protein